MRITIWVVCVVLALAGFGIAQVPTQAPAGAALPMLRQGDTSATLADVPQKVMFVKSNTTDPKTAIANVLLSDVGIQLLTSGLVPGLAWNPYMSEAFTKALKIGKGMLLTHSNDVKGFEFDTLPGLTARTTFKPEKVELDLPMDTYRPSADFSMDGVEPVLLRLETRPQDQLRVLTSRQVSIKEQKKGRFDLKPTSLREESDVQQATIPIDVERRAGNVLHITTREPLAQGEYAVVLRAKSESGAATQNIPLKAAAPPPAAEPAAPADPFAAMMGGQGRGAGPQQQPPRKSIFGGMGRGASAQQQQKTEPAPAAGGAGFLAWDFRVIQ